MGNPLESTDSSECDKLFESVTGTNIYVTRPAHQSSTMEQKLLRSVRHEPVNV